MSNSFLQGLLAGTLATQKDPKIAERRLDDAERRNRALNSEVDRTHAVAIGVIGALMSWKATAHNLKARLTARRLTEEELLAQLTAADVHVPLGDADAFQTRVVEHYAKTYTDPAIIEDTYGYGNSLPPQLIEEHENWEKGKVVKKV